MPLLLTDTCLLGGLPLPRQRASGHQRPSPLLPDTQRASWCFQLGNQAMNDGFWALARGCFNTCLSRYGDQLAVRYNLALCELATGRPRIAIQHLARAQHLAPNDEDVLARLAELAGIELHWSELDWYQPELSQDAELTLEPLQERHLPALLWQFRDPDIARRANLEPMHTPEDVQRWWQHQQQRQQAMTFAVMHRDLGFSGICGLNRVDDVAYFYFWMGTDCQQKGLGPRAATLAIKQMQRLGVDVLYTAVYPDNVHSRKALQRSGFRHLNVDGKAGESRVCFYGCPLQPGITLAGDEEEMQDVLDWLDSGFVVST